MYSRIACLTLLFSFLTSLAWATPPENGIEWETDLLKARTKALKVDKPILIVFGAEWCTFCKKMEQTTLAEKEMVKAINERFVPVHLDFDKSKAIAKALEVKGIPSSIVISTDADVLARKDGFAKSEEYLKILAKGLYNHQIRTASGTREVE
ncbi:MAG: thioredoxin family protein [Planctomycetaceae bacterium]|nr:thioredoxin family protein [Planctomycetaceae bacterium]